MTYRSISSRYSTKLCLHRLRLAWIMSAQAVLSSSKSLFQFTSDPQNLMDV